MEIRIPLDLLVELGVLLVTLGSMWAFMKAELRDLRRQVEEHGPDVKKINPIEARMEQFEIRVNDAVMGLRSDMKGVAAGLQELALAVARKAA